MMIKDFDDIKCSCRLIQKTLVMITILTYCTEKYCDWQTVDHILQITIIEIIYNSHDGHSSL